MNIDMDNMGEDRIYKIKKVAYNTIIINIILFIIKIFTGIVSNSTAMISDAIHSVSDVLSTVIVLIGINISKKDADEHHNYGHEKFESIAGLILGMILFLTAIWILINGVKGIILVASGQLASVGILALFAAILSIGVKEWMYRFTVKVANKLKSTSLKADAWHHRSDALSSIGSLIGIAGSMLGFAFFDPLAAIVIGFLIAKVSINILKEAISQITDKAIDNELYQSLSNCICEVKAVNAINLLKSRIHGNRIYIDLEIVVDNTLSIVKAHQISEEVHDKVESSFPDIKHCMVHVHPSE